MPSYNGTNEDASSDAKNIDIDNAGYTLLNITADATAVTADHTHASQKMGSKLTTHDISYSIFTGAGCPCSKKQEKLILNGINVVLKPGLNAIMGPTGCGKTTLLDVLAGRIDHETLSGTLLLDGKPPPRNFKCMMGYVVQENILLDTLTVRDNLNFSAALRFPRSMSDVEKKEKVEQTILELDLQHCADTKVGGDFARGVSGGEKKRCHIGMEIIISPPVLFLDEPTSGLDASTAKSIILLLKRLSQAGRTIVFSIHQPRYGVFRLIDNIVVMSRGDLVYQGPPMECLDFFQTIGYVCEKHDNPADFILDVINSEHDVDSDRSDRAREAVHDKIVLAYRQSRWKKIVDDTLQPVIDQYTEHKFRRPPAIQYATSPITQFVCCCKRALLAPIRTPASFVTMIITTVLMASIIGGIYWQIDKSCKSGLQNRVGVFFFILSNTVFSNISAVDLFIKNRGHFLHETISGFYRTSVYFLSSVLCDIAIMRLIPTFVFSLVSYFMIGLTVEAHKYGIFLLTLFMASLAAASVSFLISALVKTYPVANLIVSLLFMFMAVFSGLLVNLDSVPKVLHWLKYVSIFRYSLTLLSINELRDKEFGKNSMNETCASGNNYLVQQGISFQTDWDLWFNILILFIIISVALVLAYLRLRFMDKRQKLY